MADSARYRPPASTGPCPVPPVVQFCRRHRIFTSPSRSPRSAAAAGLPCWHSIMFHHRGQQYEPPRASLCLHARPGYRRPCRPGRASKKQGDHEKKPGAPTKPGAMRCGSHRWAQVSHSRAQRARRSVSLGARAARTSSQPSPEASAAAALMAALLPTNNPAPMMPPMEIIIRCRARSDLDRREEAGRSTSEAFKGVSLGCPGRRAPYAGMGRLKTCPGEIDEQLKIFGRTWARGGPAPQFACPSCASVQGSWRSATSARTPCTSPMDTGLAS